MSFNQFQSSHTSQNFLIPLQKFKMKQSNHLIYHIRQRKQMDGKSNQSHDSDSDFLGSEAIEFEQNQLPLPVRKTQSKAAKEPTSGNVPEQYTTQSLQNLVMRLDGRYSRQDEHQINKNVETRFKYIDFPTFHLSQNETSIHNTQINQWLATVCDTVFSTSFKYFVEDQLSESKTKIFCSENILRAIIKLTKDNKMAEEDFNLINKTLRQKILPYSLLKYPLSETKQVNRKLDKFIPQIDNLQTNANNMLSFSKISFKYREDGNYNDYIMMFINEILDKPDCFISNSMDREMNEDSQDEGKQEKLFQSFQKMMVRLFQIVESEDQMKIDKQAKKEEQIKNEGYLSVRSLRSMKSRKSSLTINHDVHNMIYRINKHEGLNEELKEKAIKQEQAYRAKVKEYTKHLIGRKISSNQARYSPEEISQGDFQIKSSAVLRILTKWCEELQKKYDDEDFFIQKSQQFILENHEQIYLDKKSRKALSTLIVDQKKLLKGFMDDIIENNHNQQSAYGYSRLVDDQNDYLPQLEKAMGKFAMKNVMNSHNYIINYLNKLIHGLLKAGKTLFQSKKNDDKVWNSPLMLLSFTIGDLIRCKCSSKEKQIMRILGELQEWSDTMPEQIQIVRVKNRLRDGTKDILINAKFKKEILCEIQLAINDEKSKFITCSDKFNHYLYELKRSAFGPISELCSIWVGLDQKSKQFKTIIQRQNLHRLEDSQKIKERIKSSRCKHQQKHRQVVRLPFTCGTCQRYFVKNSYINEHERCELCSLYICALCSMAMIRPEVVKKKFFSSIKGKFQFNQMKQIPEYGACLNLMCRYSQAESFKKMQIRNMVYLFSYHGSILKALKVFKKKKQKEETERFLNNYVVFKLQGTQIYEDLTPDVAKRNYIFPKMIEECFKKEKESLMIQQEGIDEEILVSVKGTEQAREKIQKLNLRGNVIKSIDGIVSRFLNVKVLQLTNNHIINIDSIVKLENLEILSLEKNQITQLPENIGNLKRLKFLDIESNEIQELPRDIRRLSNLKTLELSYNTTRKIIPEIGALSKLEKLSINSMKLNKLPEKMSKLKSLKRLWAKDNNIEKFIDQCDLLKSLTILDLSKNNFSQFPHKIGEIKTLQTLILNQNNLYELDPSIEKLKHLQKLQVTKNMLREVPKEIGGLQSLIELNLSQNNIIKVHKNIGLLQKLQTLNLSRNSHLQELPQSISRLVKLTELNLSDCGLQTLPLTLADIPDLHKLVISHNKFTQIPKVIFKLDHLFELDLRHNLITKIESSIQSLQNLGKMNLFLQNNDIQYIEDESALIFLRQKVANNGYRQELIRIFMQSHQNDPIEAAIMTSSQLLP